MKTANLLLIGGAVVLGGIYLTNKKTKDEAKADAEAKVLALALENAKPQENSDSSSIVPNLQDALIDTSFNEPTQIFGAKLPDGTTNTQSSSILPNPVDVIPKIIQNTASSTSGASAIIAPTRVEKNLKGYTWAGTSGDSNASACSQSAGQSLYSENATMVAGDTVYADLKGISIFNGKNAYWKKYAGGTPYQTMQINDRGVVSNVSSCY
jgi:hypothetical protein